MVLHGQSLSYENKVHLGAPLESKEILKIGAILDLQLVVKTQKLSIVKKKPAIRKDFHPCPAITFDVTALPTSAEQSALSANRKGALKQLRSHQANRPRRMTKSTFISPKTTCCRCVQESQRAVWRKTNNPCRHQGHQDLAM